MAVASAAAPSTDSSTQAARLAAHSAYLDGLIAMVPPKFYFPADPEEVARKFQKYTGKQPQVPKHERKMQANERKRARLDPDQANVAEQIVANAEEELAGGEGLVAAGNASGEGNYAGLNGGVLVSTVGDLRDRLTVKLQEMRGSRGGSTKDAASRERKEKQPKHQAPKRSAQTAAEAGCANGASSAGSSGTGSKRAGSALEFNKIAAAASAPKASNKKLSTAQLLAQAEEKERLRRDRLSAPDGGGEDAQIYEWQKALEKAGGIKQKDNPKLLRKTLKRQERQKKKSSREWMSRIKTVEKAKLEKQARRTQNLSERKTKNKNRAASMKKRAGFEGKRSFLN
ncbi:hypothetical protein AB1Y20_021239 [Prymnesium parvum]|uniref:Ribosomal RNA-processing protein 14/surfeit locus protein 6 C-terminal domain-containing protein n=1 Tax=Prymnesium parvum TaxID=97485 RepID=A0AB34JHR5_PRYPA